MRSEEFWTWFDDYAAPRLIGRKNTFIKMFQHLDSVGGRGPVHIIETGALEDENKWKGNGCSSILFDKYVATHPGSTCRSVDINQDNAVLTRKVCRHVMVRCGDSVQALKDWSEETVTPIVDLLYLDASHLWWHAPVPAQLHHLNELMAAMPMLRPHTLVVVDDSPAVMDDFPSATIGGKGGMVAQYAFSVGADLAFVEYQVGWTNMTNVIDIGHDRSDSAEVTSIEDLIYRARAHVEADRMTAASFLYRRVLNLTITHNTPVLRVARGEACMYFAKAALQNSRFGMAADWYNEALRADRRAVDYRIDLATKCLFPIGATDAAITHATIASRIEPDNPETWHAIGALQHEAGNLEAAREAYDKEMEVGQDVAAALNRSTVALDMEDYDLVAKLCGDPAVMTSDRKGDALHVLAMSAFRQDKHEEAITLFDQAIANQARDPGVVHWHKSMAMECLGLYPDAWSEREYRSDQVTRPQIAIPYKRFDRPLWDGAPAAKMLDQPVVIPESLADGQDATEAIQGLIDKAGRKSRIHVHAEAGAGDNIAMMRYLPQLVEMGWEVCYETTRELVDIARQSFPMIEVIPNAIDYPGTMGLKDFDCHCPIGGLQKGFQATIDNPGWRGPYIQADPGKVEQFSAMLTGHQRGNPNPRKIGLCWSSGIRLGLDKWLEKYGRQKSMHRDQFDGLIHYYSDDLQRRPYHYDRFVSLQVGPERDQNDEGGDVVEILPEKPNWTDTAALISCLDLVITVDTAVAHLAGAMGKPVWVLVPIGAGGSWHFMSARPGAPWNERSPWYPSVRVFRQQTPGDWAKVIEEVGRELEKSCEDERLVG